MPPRNRHDWEIYDRNGGPYRTGLGELEAHDLVVMDADQNGLYVKHFVTQATIRWSDVCSEPWPNRPDDPDGAGDPNYPYGAPPEDWPYGNGC